MYVNDEEMAHYKHYYTSHQKNLIFWITFIGFNYSSIGFYKLNIFC